MSKKDVIVGTHRRRKPHGGWTQVRAYTYEVGRRGAAKTAAKRGRIAPPPVQNEQLVAELADLPEPETSGDQAQAVPDDAEVTSLGIRTAMAAGAALGAGKVLLDVLLPTYGLVGALLRAIVPLGLEMIAGHAVVDAFRGRMQVNGWLRALVVIAGLAVIGGGLAGELVAAQVAPAAAARARVAAVQPVSVAACKVDLPAAPANEGPHAKLQREENAGKALALQAQCLTQAGTQQQQATANAKAVLPGEALLPTILSVLGSIGSSCFLPLLECFMRARRRRQ